MQKQNIVVLTGAGISAESGLQTFRGAGGLWNGYKIEEVASIDAWYHNPQRVLDFYNMRRADAMQAQPNAAHKALAELEQYHHVQIITQNVDDLHERGGSTKVLHLHGKLREVRSSQYANLIYDIGGEPIKLGDKCEGGAQLRPNIVWFGEMVPLMEDAMELTSTADLLLVVGTMLTVYPAASLIHYVRRNTPIYLVDPAPNKEAIRGIRNLTICAENATLAVPALVEQWTKNGI
ncbi:MAG: NAD-dependent deacylase [Chitinophagales bacterium]|nr:NAD-dependent deacylase [Chitinophagales bacterium]